MKHFSGIDYEHFLDDIRDMYPFSMDEAILVELIANSLDAKSSLIDIRIDPTQNLFELTDNGVGMDGKGFESYHNFSTSFKRKGQGIGFAGLGAKLALRITDRIITETRQIPPLMQGSRSNKGQVKKKDGGRRNTAGAYWGASEWRFERKGRAHQPVWYDIDGRTLALQGTKVKLLLKGRGHQLLSPDSVKNMILTHYLPLLTFSGFYESLRLYRHMTILVNGEVVNSTSPLPQQFKEVVLHRGRSRTPFALARFEFHSTPLPETLQGIAVTTFGKIIKRDFLKQYFNGMDRVTGMIEVPELVECLTTNKCDFRKDGTPGRKYYRFSKIAQQEFRRWLEVQEIIERKEHTVDKDVERLQRVVNRILVEIPDLHQFYGGRVARESLVKEGSGEYSGNMPEPTTRSDGTSPQISETPLLLEKALVHASRGGQTLEEGDALGAARRVRTVKFGPRISYSDAPERDEISWMEGDTVLINVAHPAYKKAVERKSVEYHNLIATVLALLRELPTAGEKLVLLEKFVSGWGKV